MLEVSGLIINYGPFIAVNDISIKVEAKEIVGVVGPNGAGKSSIVRAIGGLVKPKSGRISFGGSAFDELPAHERIRRGCSIVPEGRGLFPQMSVEENLLMGAYALQDGARVRAGMERCFEFFPILAERRRQIAGTLSGGQQQMLAISVGLMSEPTLCILDEPSLGLAPIVIAEIGKTLRLLRESGLTVLLFEQNAKLTCSVSDRIYIVASGQIQHYDRADRILSNPELIKHLV
jgi:branched-chain amino acid transport system ATP-binding protein